MLIYWLSWETQQAVAPYGVLALLLEFSNIFIQFRWFIFEYQIKSTAVAFINSALLFLSYFVFRIVYHSYISFWLAWPYSYELFWQQSDHSIMQSPYVPVKNPFFYRSAGIFCWFCNFLSQLVNVYWFFLIVKQVRRNYLKAIGRGGNEEDIQKGFNKKEE